MGALEDADSRAAVLEEAHRHLVTLYDISKILTHVESVEGTVRAVIARMARSLPARSALVVLQVQGRLKTISWAAEGLDSNWLLSVERRALASYAYFIDAAPGKAGPDGPASAEPGVPEAEAGPFIQLPLVVDTRPVFGVLQVAGALRPSEQDLMFVNAVVNQLAIALEWHASMEARQALEKARTSLAEAAQDTAEASQKRYEALVDNLDHAIVWEADARSLKMAYVSAAAERLVGYPRQRWLTEADFWFERVHSEDRELVRQTFERALKEGANQLCEHRFLTAKGRMLWLHTGVHLETDGPSAPQLQGVSTDITSLKNTESIQRFFAEIGSAIDSSMDYQETLTLIARLAVPHFAGACFFEILEEDGPARRYGTDEPAWKQEPAEAGPWRKVPILIRGRAIGSFCFTAAPNWIDGQTNLGIAEEVARRAGLAIDNAQLFRKAEQESRMRKHLLAVVSHDLRNPLSAVLMSSALLLQEVPSAERGMRAGKNLDIIRRSAMEMNRLIGDLLDTASIEAGHFPLDKQPQEAGKLLQDALGMLESQAASKSITLSAVPPRAGICVMGDRQRIQQVFSNVVGNAIKFTQPGGAVTLKAEAQGSEVTFSVSDTGVGIVPEELPHVFERFWQGSHATRPGTGLGLVIAKGIVEAHGGRIWLESAPGAGTTVFFTLQGLAPAS